MAYCVCSGATLKCSMGSQKSNLAVMHPVEPVRVEGKPIAAMMDYKPFFNIKPFGQCQSLANPTVAAATAANYGRLQRMPCVPNTTSPWMGTKTNMRIKGQQALLDSSKLMCAWAGMIEITDPGQDMIKESGTPIRSKTDSVKSEAKTGNLAVGAGSGEEPEGSDGLTIKDFAEVLERIEKKKNCYESARHYAAYHLDYWELTKLARRYIDETDKEKKEQEKDNDPNLMPSRYMLLYGADDSKLRANGCLDLHHDDFAEPAVHEISVANLRKALRLLGHDVEETGPFDEPLLYAFLRHLGRFNYVEIDNVRENDDGTEEPLENVADRYGAATWKYFSEKNEDDNTIVDHDDIKKKLNHDYGDGLIREKGGEPHDYKSSISYHYPWVPFRMVVNMDKNDQENEKATYKIYDRENSTLIGEGTFLQQDGIECLLPDSENIRVFVDGVEMTLGSESAVVKPSQDLGVKICWAYWNGEKYIDISDETSRHYTDLSLIVKTESYRDGDNVDVTLKLDDGQPLFGATQTLNLSGLVDNHEVVFKDVLKGYTLNLGTVVAEVVKDGETVAKATISIKRPRWDDVYNSYPLYDKGTPDEKDKSAEKVFKELLGNEYNETTGDYKGTTFKNACATRVSMSLFKSGMDVKKDFLVQTGEFKGKGFIASARGLKDWLSEPDVWGKADLIIKGKSTFEEVRKKINGRNGVYIILDGDNNKKDHATLWVGANNNAIGGNNYINNDGTVYFWELRENKAKTDNLQPIKVSIRNTETKSFKPLFNIDTQKYVMPDKSLSNEITGNFVIELNPAKEYTVGVYTKDGTHIYEETYNEESPYLPKEHPFKWDGFSKNGIYKSKWMSDGLKFRISVTSYSGTVSVAEKEIIIKENVRWRDIEINNKEKRIDIFLRVNLKDGGQKGLELGGDVPKELRKRLKTEPLTQRNKSFDELETLAIEGLEYHWGRNKKHDVAKYVKIGNDKYEVYINASNTKKDSMDDADIVFSTNRKARRPHFPGSVTGAYSLGANIVGGIGSFLDNYVPEPERIYYDVGYIKSSEEWFYLNVSEASKYFKYDVAHEIGHEILKAFGGDAYSYEHKGSSTKFQKLKKDAENYSDGEIDIMPYYPKKLNINEFVRYAASEEDVFGLIWLIRITKKEGEK